MYNNTNPNGTPILDILDSERLEDLHTEVIAMRADFAEIKSILSSIQEVVEPALNDLKRSPIGKMMGL